MEDYVKVWEIYDIPWKPPMKDIVQHQIPGDIYGSKREMITQLKALGQHQCELVLNLLCYLLPIPSLK